jgi:hypothetical protein
MSRDSDSRSAASATRKHQASAPRKDQLGAAGDLMQQAWQHETADVVVTSTATRMIDSRMTIAQFDKAWLHGKEQDGKYVLEHKNANSDAAALRVQLALLIEHLDDDDRAGERARPRRDRAHRNDRRPAPDRWRRRTGCRAGSRREAGQRTGSPGPPHTIFFKSIPSPILNSMKIRPSSEMTLIDSCDRRRMDLCKSRR